MRYFLLFTLLVAPASSYGSPMVIEYVPSYSWYHGCSPTASAQIMGYWDLHGYDELFGATGWKNVRATQNVKEHISSSAHNARYDSSPDNFNSPIPPDTSLADFMGTSEGSLGYGGTYVHNIANGLENYSRYMGYNFDSSSLGVTWENYINEIDLGNPVLLNVDSSGNGSCDHSITGMGYEDRGVDGLWYASYNTWHESETINWYQFRLRSSEYRFGLYSMTSVHPLDSAIGGMDISFIGQSASVPEPATMLLFGTGLVGLVGSRLRRKK